MIPAAVTTVTVVREVEAEPGEGITETAVASGVPAVVGGAAGTERPAPGGGQERVDAVLLADPIDGLDHRCTVTDDTTGETYTVGWVDTRQAFGLDHVKAGLVRVKGRVAA